MLMPIVAFLFGLFIGSFLNVCIYRLPRNRSVVQPRSYCPRCRHSIAWYDNIPLLSYALLGGHCRHCGQQISWRYPAVELLTGGLFFAALRLEGPEPEAVRLCVFAALLTGLAFTDLTRRILPDELTLGGVAAGIALAAWVPMRHGLVGVLLGGSFSPRFASVAESVAGALFTAGLLWAVGWLYQKIRKREGLGLGDVKMIAMIGAFLGIYQTLIALMLGSLLGAVIGSAYIYLAKKDPARFPLPYGTFLAAGALAYVYLGRLIFPPL